MISNLYTYLNSIIHSKQVHDNSPFNQKILMIKIALIGVRDFKEIIYIFLFLYAALTSPSHPLPDEYQN